MRADTDVGSIITAGQSGVAWGYRLLLLQFLLMPILYVVQELTVRLGIHSGKGHGELIRDHFGKGWAWLSAAGLAVATIGALLTEFSGVAGVGQIYGIPRTISVAICAGFSAGRGAHRVLPAGGTGGHCAWPVRIRVFPGRLSGAPQPA
jgi:Mn2+/Fe2+ NRAMP family transporter